MSKPRTTRKKEENQTVTNVWVNMNGACIEVQNVKAAKAGPTLKAILNVFREILKEYPELRSVHPTTGGYSPIEYVDDLDWTDSGRKKTGFRLN